VTGRWTSRKMSTVIFVLLLTPLLLLAGWASVESIVTSQNRFVESRSSKYRACRELQALEIITEGSLCLTHEEDGDSAKLRGWDKHVVLVDKKKDDVIDPETELGPQVDANQRVITIALRRPAWEISAGDTVRLCLLPAIATPAAGGAVPTLTCIDDVTIIAAPWTDETTTGELDQALVALPQDDPTVVDLIAASAVGVPSAQIVGPATPETAATSDGPSAHCDATQPPVATSRGNSPPVSGC